MDRVLYATTANERQVGAISLRRGCPPQSANYITVVVVPLLALVTAHAAILCVFMDRLPVGWVQAGAIILSTNRAPARANSHDDVRNSAGVAADRHTVTRSPVFGSVFIGQQNCGNRTVILGDYVESFAGWSAVAAKQTSALRQGIFVRLFVIGAELLTPIAAVVAAQEGP